MGEHTNPLTWSPCMFHLLRTDRQRLSCKATHHNRLCPAFLDWDGEEKKTQAFRESPKDDIHQRQDAARPFHDALSG